MKKVRFVTRDVLGICTIAGIDYLFEIAEEN